MAYNPLAFGLMLIGIGALLLSKFLIQSLRKEKDLEKTYGVLFFLLGIIGLIFAFGIYILQPIPNQYIEVYGPGYFVFSILALGFASVLYYNLDIRPLTYISAMGGLILLNSARIVYTQNLSKSPLATTMLFAVCGIGCIGSLFGISNNKWRWFVAGVFLVAGLFALYSGFSAQAGHVVSALATKP